MKAKQKQPTTIDEYIADFPEDVQESDGKSESDDQKGCAACRGSDQISDTRRLF